MTPYETLRNAILKLEPFGEFFCERDHYCTLCDESVVHGCINHKQECPVTHLRKLLVEGES